LQDGHARALLAFLVPSITDPAQWSSPFFWLVHSEGNFQCTNRNTWSY
jgi:hypothetical protein